MAWQTPKTDWKAGDVPTAGDFNKIEENIRILGEYNRAPGYGVASGINAKSITLNPAPGSYYDGLCFAFKNATQNTGAVTINVNGMGAKHIKKPNGNDLVPGNLKAGSVYTVRYNGTNFILQGSDSSGNATPGDVTAGKTFSNDDDTDLVGTLPILGNRSTTLIINGPSTPQVVIPSGRIDQSTIVAKIDPSKASIIKLGETLGGVAGTLKEALYYTNAFSQGYGHKSINVSFDCPFVPTILVAEVSLSIRPNSTSEYAQYYRQFRRIDTSFSYGYFGYIDKMLISQAGVDSPNINTTAEGYGRTGNAFVSYSSSTGKITVNFSTNRTIVEWPAYGCRGVTYCEVVAYKF